MTITSADHPPVSLNDSSWALPAIGAPMFLLSGPQLVQALCRAGMPAAFPAPNARNLETLEQWMQQLADGSGPNDAPWLVNLIAHRSYARLEAELELVVKYRPPVVITALGSPRAVLEAVQGYGGKVFADVNSLQLAGKAAAAGVDGLVLVCAGAGGHTGALTPMTFVPAVRRFFTGTLVVGGGITTGAGIRAVRAMGADYAYLGTLFIAARESLAAQEYKQMVVDCDASDLVISKAVTGVNASWLRPSLQRCGIDPDNIAKVDFSSAEDAKRWRDIWAAGQGLGEVHSIRPAADIVRDLAAQYHGAMEQDQ